MSLVTAAYMNLFSDCGEKGVEIMSVADCKIAIYPLIYEIASNLEEIT